MDYIGVKFGDCTQAVEAFKKMSGAFGGLAPKHLASWRVGHALVDLDMADLVGSFTPRADRTKAISVILTEIGRANSLALEEDRETRVGGPGPAHIKMKTDGMDFMELRYGSGRTEVVLRWVMGDQLDLRVEWEEPKYTPHEGEPLNNGRNWSGSLHPAYSAYTRCGEAGVIPTHASRASSDGSPPSAEEFEDGDIAESPEEL